jgi:hypothetical protein
MEGTDRTAFAATVALGLADDPERPDDVVVGEERWVLGARVGEGGMGTVVEAEDRQFARKVAVKRLLHPTAAARERFRLEAIVTGNLEHPGVPTVYERGIGKDGVPYYAMRLVRGKTLADAIDEAKTRADKLKLLPAIVRVAQTIGYAHEQGVVHRDVKPENVLIGRHGEAVVLDWGIAKVRGVKADPLGATSGAEAISISEKAKSVSNATAHGSIVGTPAYMAPEQASGDPSRIDERTDVFALGALLYHLFAGQGPYADAKLADIVARATAADFPSLDRVAADTPPALRAICAKAMAREPSARYQTAHELALALEAFQAGALAGESGMANTVATAGAVMAILILVAASSFLLMNTASVREQGFFASIYPLLGFGGIVLSVVEWRTRGRHHLAPLSLALVAAVVLGGLGATLGGIEMVFKGLTAENVQADPELYRMLVTHGTYESLGLLANASLLAAVQALFWALAKRATLLARRAEKRT